jgi:hypothetical protein
MPRFNGTGPRGLGAGTGRGLGPCGGGQSYGRRGLGQGLGLRRGFGWRNFGGYYSSQAPTKEEETNMLSEEAEVLKEELKVIKSRLEELKSKK